jgi:hypothetical protein
VRAYLARSTIDEIPLENNASGVQSAAKLFYLTVHKICTGFFPFSLEHSRIDRSRAYAGVKDGVPFKKAQEGLGRRSAGSSDYRKFGRGFCM